MKPTATLRLLLDLGMTGLLLLLMSFERIGRAAHEWIGLGIFVLFIAHHVLNRKWAAMLGRGKYSPLRILQTAIAALTLLAMLGSMLSAAIMSQEVFAFIPLFDGLEFARALHMLSAYWGFIFMGLHLGLHWGMILGILRKKAGIAQTSAAGTWGLRVLALAVSGFGVYALFKNNIPDYLFLRSHFVFFDWSLPLAAFFAEQIAMLALWAYLGYYAAKALQKRRPKLHS